MSISRAEVAKIAKLSRIAMSEAELERFSDQLSRILDYVEKLNQLDTSAVAPLSHALPVANVFRDDTAAPSLPVEQVLANAPERTGCSFKVPRVLDEGTSA
jgi:aspartyl-tRNA(Asn)/glutamyl-tRNA(Gln) amidotransferase subunit C